jgi:hypothetical protein
MEININLNKSGSLTDAIKKIKAYREDIDNKLDELVRTLADNGVTVARSWLGATQGDSTRASVGLEVDSSGNIHTAIISLEGEDALFIEFGAGIHYNGSDPPHAAEFGYGVGTYNPASDNAWNPDGWWYWTGTERKHSYGTEGTYPVFHAAENMRNQLIMKALQIFRS